jgi:hypothetical protein
VKKLISCVLVVGTLSAPLLAQTKEIEFVEVKQRLSYPLMFTGALTAIVGVGFLVPHGEIYTIEDRSYCVTERSIKSAADCYPGDPLIKAGLIIMGVGAAMAIIGSLKVTKKVRIAPSQTGIGAIATVKW